MAFELVLTLHLVFHLALRQAEGFTRSLLALLGLELHVPDHTTPISPEPVVRGAAAACSG